MPREFEAAQSSVRFAVYAEDDPQSRARLFDRESDAHSYRDAPGMRAGLVLERRDPDGTRTRLA